ncbi:hypothetical protein BC943DRAFT_334561 [Umbelopsis sp. AD052]|nr:hypothetical protein BC943DRAFT_334561 [Umbelopsis sp. AD052]
MGGFPTNLQCRELLVVVFHLTILLLSSVVEIMHHSLTLLSFHSQLKYWIALYKACKVYLPKKVYCFASRSNRMVRSRNLNYLESESILPAVHIICQGYITVKSGNAPLPLQYPPSFGVPIHSDKIKTLKAENIFGRTRLFVTGELWRRLNNP